MESKSNGEFTNSGDGDAQNELDGRNGAAGGVFTKLGVSCDIGTPAKQSDGPASCLLVTCAIMWSGSDGDTNGMQVKPRSDGEGSSMQVKMSSRDGEANSMQTKPRNGCGDCTQVELSDGEGKCLQARRSRSSDEANGT